MLAAATASGLTNSSKIFRCSFASKKFAWVLRTVNIIMDIVTVTYGREFEQQLIQSRSINQFILEPITHYIIIEDRFNIQQWTLALEPIYTRHRLVIIHDHPEFLRGYVMPKNRWKNEQGWIRQQCLKLWIHTRIETDRYLVLDSKNWITRETDPEQWPMFDGCGVILDFKPSVEDYSLDCFWQWAVHCSNALGRPIPKTTFSPITPFILRTDRVAEICGSVNIDELFRFPFPSEFILYAFFSDPGPYRLEPVHFTVWGPFWELDEAKVRAIEEDPEIQVFAIHREHDHPDTWLNVAAWQARLGLVR